MSGHFIVIPAGDEPAKVVRCEEKGSWPLETAQKLVGGYVELIRVKVDGTIRDALVDEDGISKGKPINQRATKLYKYSNIVGTMVIWIPDRRVRKPAVATIV